MKHLSMLDLERISVELAPEGMDLLDVRYNAIQWVTDQREVGLMVRV